jgi:hypothetical protein
VQERLLGLVALVGDLSRPPGHCRWQICKRPAAATGEGTPGLRPEPATARSSVRPASVNRSTRIESETEPRKWPTETNRGDRRFARGRPPSPVRSDSASAANPCGNAQYSRVDAGERLAVSAPRRLNGGGCR